MVKRELSLKRIYHSICSECDHPRFRHGSYHSDYSIGVMNDRCQMEDCDCLEFKSYAKIRSPHTWEAARIHVYGKVREAEELKRDFLYYHNKYAKEYCGHCGQYQYTNHLVEHVYQPTIDNAKDDIHHIPEILADWKQNIPSREKESSMPLRNSASCSMFRCLLCFRYIFPDDAVEPHGEGYVHKICAGKRYLVRS